MLFFVFDKFLAVSCRNTTKRLSEKTLNSHKESKLLVCLLGVTFCGEINSLRIRRPVRALTSSAAAIHGCICIALHHRKAHSALSFSSQSNRIPHSESFNHHPTIDLSAPPRSAWAQSSACRLHLEPSDAFYSFHQTHRDQADSTSPWLGLDCTPFDTLGLCSYSVIYPHESVPPVGFFYLAPHQPCQIAGRRT